MKAWLIVNGFIDSKKFHELYGYLKRAGEKCGTDVEIITSDSLTCKDDIEIKKEAPDFVLFWDKDIHLGKRLEGLGIRLYNSARSIEICDNKALTYAALKGKVALPRTLIAPKTFEGVGYCKLDFVENATRLLGLPMIIKESYGSFGAQVYLAKTLDEAKKTVTSLAAKDFIMQEFIEESKGRDVRVNVVGGKVVSAMERYNDKDFRSNITNGGRMRKIEITEEMKSVAILAADAIGLDFAGVDVLFGKDGPVVCEVNSNPHFKSSLECTGVDMSEEILAYITECQK